MITFIDLFAGIGGFRLAFESVGAKCVFSAEIDKHACATYKANFGDDPYCDVSQLDPMDMPDFDILCNKIHTFNFYLNKKRLPKRYCRYTYD